MSTPLSLPGAQKRPRTEPGPFFPYRLQMPSRHPKSERVLGHLRQNGQAYPAIGALIVKGFDIWLSVSTVGQYLRHWGFVILPFF